MSTWQEAARQALAEAYPADMKADELLRAVREAGFPSTAKSTLYLWLKARGSEGTVDRVAHGRYRAGKAVMEPGQHDHMVLGSGCRQCSCTPPGEVPGAQEDGPETSPEVLRDLIGVAAGVMIPGPVIATWTPAERRAAEEWAASEHLRASDNTGIAKRPYPRIVQEAVVLASNPGMAQLAVEAWMHRKESIEREAARVGGHGSMSSAYAGSLHRETVDIAQAAITGLLVLLDGPAGLKAAAPSWGELALEILEEHPQGMTVADLAVLLGSRCPPGDELNGWLAQGRDLGLLVNPVPRFWRLAKAGG